MKLTDGQKSLIIGLLAVVAVTVSVMYFVKPNYDETQAIKAECETLQARLNELQEKQSHREEYLAGIDEFEEAFAKKMENFAPDLNQEVSIMFVQGIKDDNEFQVSSLGLGHPEQFYTLGYSGGDAVINEAAPAEDPAIAGETLTEGDAPAADSAYNCYRADFPIAYTGSYEDLKNVVAYVDNFQHRMTINSVNIAYNAETEMCTGSMDMKCYAITGPGRPETSLELNEIETGAENIFVGDGASASAGSQAGLNKYDENDGAAIENSYDFYAMLNPSSSDVSAKVVGQNGAGKDASVISNSDNSISTLNYDFYEQDGKTYCKYTLDSSTSYEAEVTSAEDIKLLIQSSARKDDDDKVGVKITITNNSSLPVYVKVSGDDSVAPRVDISSKSGAVKVY